MSTAHDRETARRRLRSLTADVTLLVFTQSTDVSEAATSTRQIVAEVAAMSGRIGVEQIDVAIDTERTAALRISRTPAIAVLSDGRDTRMRFLGAPAGYEFMSLVEAAAVAGGSGSAISSSIADLISSHATSELDILVFVAPTCATCSSLVQLAHRMAFENRLIRATCVDATEFIELAQHHRVNGVPITVVNGETAVIGAMSEDEFVRTVVRRAGPIVGQ